MDLKKKLEDAKNAVKRHIPEITFAAIAIIATAYAVTLKERFPEGETTYLALNAESMEKLKNGYNAYWIFDEHKIDLAYDPDC